MVIALDRRHPIALVLKALANLRKALGFTQQRQSPVDGRRKVDTLKALLERPARSLSEDQRGWLAGQFRDRPGGARLQAAYDAKEAFLKLWECPDRATAADAFACWRHGLAAAGITEVYAAAVTTLGRDWREEFLAAIARPGAGTGYVEALNRQLKRMHGKARGLLGRFRKIDAGKAEDLRRELHKATGEMLPYRIAPLGEGFREPTEEEKIAAAPKIPFGSAQGADRWAAGNMADVLLGRGDYADAITHFRGEIGRNRDTAMPYLAAVHEIMGDKNPGLAAKFATQMQKAGLAAEPEKKPDAATESVPAPTPAPAATPEPPKPEPASQPEPVPPTPPATQPTESKPAPVPPAPTPTAQPNQTAPQPAKEAEKPSLPSPTNRPIDPQALYEQLGYNHEGDGHWGALKNAPVDGVRAKAAASEAFEAAEKQYGKDNPVLNNGEGDAFRHALWSYKMAKSIGSDGAKAFGDAHERQNSQAEDSERLMDLYNNDIGRKLASDPKNNGRSDEEVIMEAIREGKLQLRPFSAPGGSRFQQKPRY